MSPVDHKLPPPPDVAGTVLDGSNYTIGAEENRIICESSGVTPADDGAAHPIFALVATQIGMKYSVGELLALCEFDVADGPMMAGCEIVYQEPLQVGETYAIRGRIESLVRKPSKRLGVMDLLTHRLELYREDGSLAASTINTWVLPRGGKA